jgi:hypothetical protein
MTTTDGTHRPPELASSLMGARTQPRSLPATDVARREPIRQAHGTPVDLGLVQPPGEQAGPEISRSNLAVA